ncbi:cell division protein ZapA [Conservatibacter flavescens]|uniref:Cell division protein ZapA n=1 Tax=Conservatibacter flavescens TaxID=28161 RepID=A0A2M8S061_9PAST|nr:cell division protein ZapA [Conservatibacter flavescens]PJG84533.1 cell division protein ZapA [Conservatibacter flavescens]
MSSKNIELSLFGQVLRLNCPEEQHSDLRAAAESLENKVFELKERAGIVQLERALAIVGLNLSYELAQAQRKNDATENLWQSRLQQLDHSLENILTQQNLYKTQ